MNLIGRGDELANTLYSVLFVTFSQVILQNEGQNKQMRYIDVIIQKYSAFVNKDLQAV